MTSIMVAECFIVPEFIRPTYSEICFGLLSAAWMVFGASIFLPS